MNSEKHRLEHHPFHVPPGKHIKLSDYSPSFTAGFKNKTEAEEALLEDVSELSRAQEVLWASGTNAVLIIFQALDAAGKDGAIKHVMSGVNPQGCEVHSFKAPTEEERARPFLWRPARVIPARGRIGIFNRSYYEEVLVVRVHPEFLESQWIPTSLRDKNLNALWKSRYEDINSFEEWLTRSGVCIIKFFLNVSKKEQKKRFLERLENPEKQWKFVAHDLQERGYWDQYMEAYEEMLTATSTESAPWYVIPADKKWFTRACVADIITARIDDLKLAYPTLSERAKAELQEFKKTLERGEE